MWRIAYVHVAAGEQTKSVRPRLTACWRPRLPSRLVKEDASTVAAINLPSQISDELELIGECKG